MPWGFIIGLLIGGFLMFMLVVSDSKMQEKKERFILDDLDNTLAEFTSINVVYDHYNAEEIEKCYVFYSCLVSRLMWKGLKIEEAGPDYVKFNKGNIIRFSTSIAEDAMYFVRKDSIMIDFIPKDKEFYEF